MSEDKINKELEGSMSNDNPVSDLYEDWFLDYASYVILERAIPSIDDGLKPVQRRILHSMNNIEDGRYNKCANIIGSSMQFHPHGDASIEDALVNLGQKDLLIDTQGNWGDVRTGDKAAASRYIEARISKFGLETLFNEKTTLWKLSYDGRKKEPTNLPVKFPLLLAQGVEGIAVGLSTKIMPHNFCELIKSSISYLKGKSFKLYPDFPNGGMVDITDYNDGKRGGKIRVRSKIREFDKSTLVIDDIPYNTTTTSLIDSIIKANDKGKIKIRKVVDNTAEKVEILVHLHKNQSPSITIDALYAFTDCEVSISPNACVIVKEKPEFIGVKDILKYSAESTKNLLKKELEIRRDELKEKILFSTLERIFIENKISSELSGNMIDLCPVGALNNKPYRYKARTWDLREQSGVSPHDCIGSNIFYHTYKNKILRAVPKENPDVNQTWLSDRDRFGYEGIYSKDRIFKTLIRQDNKLIELDKQLVADKVNELIKASIKDSGEDNIGCLISPQSTNEELFLFQKVFRGLGINNIDHRTNECDFSYQDHYPIMPSLGCNITCLLYTSPSPRDRTRSRMPSSA